VGAVVLGVQCKPYSDSVVVYTKTEQLALSDDGGTEPSSPLSRITRWLEKIGHKLRASNDRSPYIPDDDSEKVKGDALEVNKEIVILWLNVIMTFRITSDTNEGKHNPFMNPFL
jgi:hypothetical protein